MDLGGLSFRDIRKNALNQYLITAGSWAADDSSEPCVRTPGTAGRRPTQLITL